MMIYGNDEDDDDDGDDVDDADDAAADGDGVVMW